VVRKLDTSPGFRTATQRALAQILRLMEGEAKMPEITRRMMLPETVVEVVMRKLAEARAGSRVGEFREALRRGKIGESIEAALPPAERVGVKPAAVL
jgi:hypothetical protein